MRMEAHMKDNMIMDCLREKENFIGKMDLIIRVNSKKVLSMEKVYCSKYHKLIIRSGSFMKDILNSTNERDMEKLNGQMEVNIKVILIIMKDMVKEK